MKDKAHIEVDNMIEKIEKELLHNYTEAYKKTLKELKDTFAKMELLGVEDAKEKMKLANRFDRLNKLIDSIATDIKNINKISISIVNNNLYENYALNNEFGTYLVEHASGYNTNYNLFNREAVKEIVKENLTPFTKMAYDDLTDFDTIVRTLTRELTQSIILGESINKVAKRVQATTEKNMNDSIRIARTEMTRVQNAGRMDAFKRGEDMGLKLNKKWIATINKKTRESHAALNLVEIGLDEKFSNGLLYPGDENGAAAEVINCRCTLITEFAGLEKGAKELELDEELKKLSFEQWGNKKKEEKKTKTIKTEPKKKESTTKKKEEIKPKVSKVEKKVEKVVERKNYTGKELNSMTDKQLRKALETVALEYYPKSGINFGNKDYKEAVDLLMQNKMSKTSMIKDIKSMQNKLK